MLLDDNYGVAWEASFSGSNFAQRIKPLGLACNHKYRPWCETSVVESALALKNVT